VACWDLKGKLLDPPLHDLLGGIRRGQGRPEGTLPAYANGWWQDCYREHPESDPDPERFAAAAREVADRGFDAVKCNPFGHGPSWLPRSDLRRAVARVRAVREALGPDADLYVEGHRQLRPPAAGAVAARLESLGVGFYEEPTPPQPGEIASVAAETRIQIATGESCCTRYGFQPLLEAGGVGVLQPDPVRAGGITELRAVAAMADAAGTGFAPHDACGPVSTAACTRLAATAPTLIA
jgi:galactonate dehydratase